MSGKEVLIELLKRSFANRLAYIEKRSQEQIDSLSFTKKEFDVHDKKIVSIVKMKTDKDQKDKEDADKKEKERLLKLEKDKEKATAAAEKKRDKSAGLRDNGRKSVPGIKPSPSMSNFGARKTIGNNTDRRGTITSINTSTNAKRANTPGRRTTTNSIKPGVNNTNSKQSVMHKSSTTAHLNAKNPFASSIKNNSSGNGNGMQSINNNKGAKTAIKKEVPKLTFNDIRKGGFFNITLSFLTNHDKLNLFATNKSFFLNDLIYLIGDYHSKLYENNNILFGQTIDDKLKEIRETKESQLDTPIEDFQLSKGGAKAIDIMSDQIYFGVFKHSMDKAKLKKIIIVYKIFCQLLLKEDLVAIQNQNDFWKEICSYVMNSGYTKLNEFIKNEVDLFDFDIKNLIKIRKLVGNDTSIIVPNNFTKVCPTTGLLSFAIKDAFEYCGLIQSNKTHPGMIIKHLEYEKELIDKVEEYQIKLQAIHDKK